MEYETSEGQSYWIPMADLMTGLMMVFMLIAISYMLMVEQTTTLIVKEYENTRQDLKKALQKEFSEKLKEWDAELLGDMTLKFKNPEVLFDTGKSTLKPQFKIILDAFIPQYLKVLNSEKFKSSIKEVRIEGHTSPRWNKGATGPEDAYFKNMKLSQERTRETLEYVLNNPAAHAHLDWLRQVITANGLSSSHPIHVGGIETNPIDESASQRVEFRIVTNSEERLAKIAESLTSTKNESN
jgi:outer membrane protein OmpA-like peptidoglycan-associated protein